MRPATQDALLIAPCDDVAVALRDIEAGETVLGVVMLGPVPAGHKLALRSIEAGCEVVKYGMPIGHATRAIAAGAHVHTHNLATNLSGELDYRYEWATHPPARPMEGMFEGYLRADGRVGTRNEIWVLPTVGCAAQIAEQVARLANVRFQSRVDGVHAFPHPYGCSQLGDDHARTQALLAALAHHPNAGGVLIVGLGCENNHIESFKAALGAYDPARVKFINAQDERDEREAALVAIESLVGVASGDRRTQQPLSKLVVGLKCGGSDGFSGVSANPLLGAFSDALCAAGGTALLTEVPEMFGAEAGLFNRCVNHSVFDAAADMVNRYKRYFLRYGQPVYENPSPGNKAGGISTLEDKSLGCTQKGGSGPVVGVLDYAQPVCANGLNLVYGPGNDGCAVTGLTAAGAQLILFTTGRGTPLGAPVPTLKLSSNSALYARKPGWIDFDAGTLLGGEPMDAVLDKLNKLTLAVANGARALSEANGERAIAIFKDGVTL